MHGCRVVPLHEPARRARLRERATVTRKILVVDDEESVRLLLSTLLERDSYKVLLARDGQHANSVRILRLRSTA